MLSCLHYSKMLQLPDTCRHAALFHCCNPCHKCLFHHRNLMMSVLLAWSWSIWICTHLSAVFPHKIFFLKKNLFEKVWLVVFCLFSEVPTKVPTLYPSKAPTNLPTCKHSDGFFFTVYWWVQAWHLSSFFMTIASPTLLPTARPSLKPTSEYESVHFSSYKILVKSCKVLSLSIDRHPYQRSDSSSVQCTDRVTNKYVWNL